MTIFTVLKLIMLAISIVALPFMVGLPVISLMGIYDDRRVYRSVLAFVTGNVICFAVQQLISVPLVLTARSLTSFLLLYVVVMTVLLIELYFFAYVNSKKKNTSLFTKDYIKRVIYGFKSVPKWVWIVLIAAMLIFLFIEYHYIFKIHVDDDDARYIGNPASAWYTDTLYRYRYGTGKYIDNRYITQSPRDLVSPWMLSFALYARMSGVHPTVIAHSVMPIILIAVCYMNYFLMADKLFQSNKEKMIVFLLFVGGVYLTFSGNTHTQAAVTLVRVWQGKAAFAASIIPFMFFLYLSLANDTENRVRYYILMFITGIAGSYMSGVGIVGTGMVMGSFSFWDVLLKKKWKEIPLVILICLPTLIYGIMYAKIK